MVSRLLTAFSIPLFFGTIYSQSVSTKTDSSNKFLSRHLTNDTKIKWTRQLPSEVRTALYRSNYSIWYIEKIIRYNTEGKQIYRFYVTNGNLLDGDHRDSFLKTDSLDIANDGTILRN